MTTPSANGGTDPVPVESDRAERFQQALDEVSSQNGVIGAQATVVMPDVGRWTGVYGRSGETSPMRPEMLVPIGSVAKTVISGLVLKLVDTGALSLDDTMSDLLPPLDHVPGDVTLAHILRNDSGIASYSSGPGFADSLTADLTRHWQREEIIRLFVTAPEFAAGSSWKSSNTGYMLAEMIAERVTGIPLIDLYRQHLYDPLGLEGIAVLGAQEPAHPVAETWTGPPGGPFQNFTTTFDGASFRTGFGFVGATVMNSATLAEWGEALLGDYLSAATRDAMLTAVPDDGRIPGQTGAGLGIRRFGLLGRTQWGHSGTAFNGSAFLLRDVESGIVIALVYNQPGASHNASHFRLVERLLQLALSQHAARPSGA